LYGAAFDGDTFFHARAIPSSARFIPSGNAHQIDVRRNDKGRDELDRRPTSSAPLTTVISSCLLIM